MPPISLIFDSTALQGSLDPPSQALLALERLANHNQITLSVPDIVRREVASQERDFLNSHLAELTKSLQQVRERLDSADRVVLDNARVLVDQLGSSSRSAGRLTAIDRWIARVGAISIPVEPAHFSSALEDYFSGAPPFRQLRSRDDLPDALILGAVKSLCASRGAVVFVSADKRLREAAATLPSVEAHATPRDAMASATIQHLVQAANAVENLDLLRRILSTTPPSVVRFVGEHLSDAANYQRIESPFIPDDNNEGHLDSLDVTTDVQLLPDRLEFLGAGTVLIPFEVPCEALVSYAIFKADYYCLDDDRTAGISISDLNDHYFDAQECLQGTAYATLSLELPNIDLSAQPYTEAALQAAVMAAALEIEALERVVIDDPEA